MVIEDQPDHGVLQELGLAPSDRMHQQVHAHTIADQIFAETRIPREQGRPALIVDPITERGLDLIAVIDFESGYTHATALVDDAIRCELLYYDPGARRVELLVGDTDAHVRSVGFLQVAHQLPGAGRADHAERPGPRAGSRQPAREPNVRDAAHMIGVLVRDEDRIESRHRDVCLREPDRYAAPRVEQELFVAGLYQGRRSESIQPRRWRTRSEQGNPEKVLCVRVPRKHRRAGQQRGHHDRWTHRAPPLHSIVERSMRRRNCSAGNIVTGHQPIDDAVILAPRRLAVGMVAHDERGAGVELLVLQVAAGELRADEVPGELEELHPVDGATLRSLEAGVELAREVLVPGDGDVGGHLAHAAAAELAEPVDEGRVVLRAPLEGGVHHAPVEADVTFGPALERLDLAVDHAGDAALDRGHVAERLLHRGDFDRVRRMRDLAAQAENQAHLGPEAHVRLVVAEAVARRLDVDVAREERVVVHEHALPGHLDLVAHHHAVGLVVAPGERRVELALRLALEGLARPERQPLRARGEE